MKKNILCGLIVTIFCAASAVDYTALTHNVREYKHTKCLNSFITFIEDSEGNRYVVKQYKSRFASKLLATTVSELVALEIGQSIGVSLDQACLIPAGVAFMGKEVGLPATLHTHAPGIQFNHYNGENYQNLFLYLLDKKGLSKQVIYNMSRNRDFPLLIAFDTFVGNNDRGKLNLFYQESTDTFTGIDLGASFRRDLCAISTQNILALASDETLSLSDAEWDGLILYYQTLEQLVDLYPPEYTCAKIDEYAHAAGLFDPTYFNERQLKKWMRYFSHCKGIIRSSYKHAQELLIALEQLFERRNIEMELKQTS